MMDNSGPLGDPPDPSGDSAAIRHLLDELERYWQQIRRSGRLPARTDVDPAQIDACLPHSFIVERVAPGVLRLRVAGARLSDALGMEVRGMPLSALFLPEGRDVLAARIDEVFDGPRIMEFPIHSPRGIGRPLMAGRLLVLPLLDREGRVTRAMGAMITEGGIGRGGRRFTIPAGAEIRSDAVDGPLRPIAPAPVFEAAEEPAPFEMPRVRRVADRPGRGHLRLVVDNG
ncbi:PAS domain-containing protein [Wenxinia marina]|uniref:PAS domain-containing protein n=1 Tax=Wenxinia marina DSM 24838 TaxID=1123501 RepID=A0A0D0PZF3_9RHOB|nr:PAS domain-containing protein [Wenxinia marina]KIQ67714.1 hypothetical protein Wenmar_03673 [Wenxinia marina DSM 24838]